MCMQDFRLFSRKQNNTLLFIQKAQTNVVPKMHSFQKRTLSVSSRGFFFVWCFILTQFVCPRDVSHIQFITTFYYDSHLGNPQTSSGVLKLVQKCMMFAFGGYNSCAFAFLWKAESFSLNCLHKDVPYFYEFSNYFFWYSEHKQNIFFKLKLIACVWVLSLFLQRLCNTSFLIHSLQELFRCIR